MRARRPMTPAFPQRTARCGSRADLHEAEAPAAALDDVFLQSLRREAKRQPLVEIDRAIADLAQSQRQQIVLGHRVGRESADPHQRREADDRRCAAAECCIPMRRARPLRRRRSKRRSSGQTLASDRLDCSGSGLAKCCGVCTIATSSSRNSVIARVRNSGIGTKSASRIAMYCGGSASPATCSIRFVHVAGLRVGRCR